MSATDDNIPLRPYQQDTDARPPSKETGFGVGGKHDATSIPNSGTPSLLVVFGICALAVLLLQIVLTITPSSSSVKSRDGSSNGAAVVGGGERACSSSSSSFASRLHLRRRIQHASTGLLFLYLSYHIHSYPGSIMLLIGSLILYSFHLLRLRYSTVQRAYIQIFGPLLREHERLYSPPSAFYFLLGCGIIFLFFPLQIARMGLLCLSLSDPFAAVVGMYAGGKTLPSLLRQRTERKNDTSGKDKEKTVSGFSACFVMSLVIGCLVLDDGRDILVGSMACALSEAYGLSVMERIWGSNVALDDNLIVPIATGGAIYSFHLLAKAG